jgi:hypothetical protein
MSMLDVGDSPTLSCVFKVNGTATDPTTVTAKVKKPDGTITTYSSPTKDSTGNYHISVSIDQHGTWWHRWVGTGACEVAEEESFEVRASQF